MNLDFLPSTLVEPILKCGDKLCEIRLRCGFPVKVKIGLTVQYLTKNGASLSNKQAIICTKDDINKVIKNVTEYSIYAHNEKIKNGYLDAGNGIRIGLCGECVFDGQAIKTIKNFTSLNIRIPHEIFGCSDSFYNKLFVNDTICNTLIISSPMKGKTTILKDLVRKINIAYSYQLLVVDERGELFNIKGENVDVISYTDKKFAFECGIRTLSPDVIVTDELYSKSDWESVENAIKCGVRVIATCHASSIEELELKSFFSKYMFERYVILSSCGNLGELKGVYDKELKLL